MESGAPAPVDEFHDVNSSPSSLRGCTSGGSGGLNLQTETPCKPELVALSPRSTTWQQPESPSALQSNTNMLVAGRGCSSFQLLLRQVEILHNQEVRLARSELERKLQDLQCQFKNMKDDGRNHNDGGNHEASKQVNFQTEPSHVVQLGESVAAQLGEIDHGSKNQYWTGYQDPGSEPTSPGVLPGVDHTLSKQTSPYSASGHSAHSGMSDHHVSYLKSGMKGAFVMKTISQHLSKTSHRSQRTSIFQVVEGENRQNRLSRCMANIVKRTLFDVVCCLMIVCNAVLLGVSTDICARNQNPDSMPDYATYMDRLFTLWFVFELSLRLGAQGVRPFFFGRDWCWNLFDLVVVLTDLVEAGAYSFSRGSRTKSGLQNLTALRMLRILRIVRTVRVVRLVRFFKELRIMVFSVLRSGLLLLWFMVLLGVIIFMFSVYLVQMVTMYFYEHQGNIDDSMIILQDNFGSLMPAGYVLFQCISGGRDWGNIADPLLEIHWSNAALLCFFIFFTVFAVLNIITGIFVDFAMHSHAGHDEAIHDAVDAEKDTLSQMQRFFDVIDMDKSGSITEEELNEQLRQPHVRACLSNLGVEASDAPSIFRLLDCDNSGEISLEEFMFGCLKLKGEAKSIDLVTLIQENRRFKKSFYQFMKRQERRDKSLLQLFSSTQDASGNPRSAQSSPSNVMRPMTATVDL